MGIHVVLVEGCSMFIMFTLLKLFIRLGACNLNLGHASRLLSLFVLVFVVLFLSLTGLRGYYVLVSQPQGSVDVCVPYG